MKQISEQLLSDALYIANQYQNVLQSELEDMNHSTPGHPRIDWLENELKYTKELVNQFRELYIGKLTQAEVIDLSIEDVIDRYDIPAARVDLRRVASKMSDNEAFMDTYWMVLDAVIEDMYPDVQRKEQE